MRLGRRRARKVYESELMVKMPLLLYVFRSLDVIAESRLRSSFSIAFCLHRAWNSHSAQCRFRMSSGGELLAINAAVFRVSIRKSFASAAVFNFRVVWLSPWTILAYSTWS